MSSSRLKMRGVSVGVKLYSNSLYLYTFPKISISFYWRSTTLRIPYQKVRIVVHKCTRETFLLLSTSTHVHIHTSGAALFIKHYICCLQIIRPKTTSQSFDVPCFESLEVVISFMYHLWTVEKTSEEYFYKNGWVIRKWLRRYLYIFLSYQLSMWVCSMHQYINNSLIMVFVHGWIHFQLVISDNIIVDVLFSIHMSFEKCEWFNKRLCITRIVFCCNDIRSLASSEMEQLVSAIFQVSTKFCEIKIFCIQVL